MLRRVFTQQGLPAWRRLHQIAGEARRRYSTEQQTTSNTASVKEQKPRRSWAGAMVGHALKGVLLGIGAYGNLLFLFDKVVTKVQVEGLSMQPAINPWGPDNPVAGMPSDTVLVYKWDYRPSRGDVVLMLVPGSPNRHVVKRIAALDRDIVFPRRSHTHFDDKGVFTTAWSKDDPIVVPTGHCWVEGDNAAVSIDSNNYGPVPYGLVVGNVTHVIRRRDPTGREKWMWEKIENKLPGPSRLVLRDSSLARRFSSGMA